MLAPGLYLRTSVITGATSAIIILILGTAEIQAVITNVTIPVGVRNWLIWATLAGIVITATTVALNVLRQVQRGQAAIHRRLDNIDKLLDTGGGMRGLIRSELHDALSRGELTDAVERVLAPTLEAADDYREIRGQVASVTRLPHRN